MPPTSDEQAKLRPPGGGRPSPGFRGAASSPNAPAALAPDALLGSAERNPDEEDLLASATPGPAAAAHAPLSVEAPLCPVDRLPRRRRNEICIAVIALGMLNYVVYTIAYAVLGGDAHNGYVEQLKNEQGESQTVYFVRGHFIHSVQGRERIVSKAVWIYSYLHSITVPLTAGAVIISMLVLARPHILATMRGGWISGETFVVALGTVVVLASGGMAVIFACNMVEALWR